MSPALERVSIDGPAGTLEALAEDSAGDSFAVLCHPHPSFGGTMDNKVVTTAARALRESGVATLRFNFRGVGASSGAFDEMRGETQDAQAASAWGRKRWPGRSLIVFGFSFGGAVALRLAQLHEPRLLITIAPALRLLPPGWLAAPRCPWVVIQGEADDVVSAQEVKAALRDLKPGPELVLLPEVGHFFHGRLQELRGAVISAVRNG